MKVTARTALPTLLGCLLSLGLQAENLAEVYQNAIDNDHRLKAARATYQAQHEIVFQARGVLAPDVRLDGSATRSYVDSQASDYKVHINGHGYGLKLNQPVFNLQAWYGYKQAQAIDLRAAADLSAAEQDLIIRTAAGYFDVLRASDDLRSAQAEETAVKRQLDQVSERFNVGVSAITDVQEAQAAYDLTVVNRINAENQVEVSFRVLEAITGVRYNRLSTLSPTFPIVRPEPAQPEPWIDQVLANNYGLKSLEQSVEAARQNVQVKRAAHYPTVSLFGRYQDDYTNNAPELVVGTQRFQLRNTDQDTSSYGLELKMPLFTGGLISSQARQAAYEHEAANENLETVRRNLTQTTRILHSQLLTDVERVKARQQAVTSSESALKATEVGYEVGTRNIVELLQSQRMLYATQREYARSRYDYVVRYLQLKQATAQLAPTDLLDLNAWLQAPGSVKP